MGKINIRIFLRHLRCRLHVTPAGRKDNVTALVDTFLNRLLCRILIGIWAIDRRKVRGSAAFPEFPDHACTCIRFLLPGLTDGAPPP